MVQPPSPEGARRRRHLRGGKRQRVIVTYRTAAHCGDVSDGSASCCDPGHDRLAAPTKLSLWVVVESAKRSPGLQSGRSRFAKPFQIPRDAWTYFGHARKSARSRMVGESSESPAYEIAQNSSGARPLGPAPLSEEVTQIRQATRSQATFANLARSCSTISACRWQTRDSLTPSTCPISAIVSRS